MQDGFGRRLGALLAGLGLGVWAGAVVAAFVAVQVLFAQLPRDTAGRVAGEIFSRVEVLKYLCFGGAFAGHLLFAFTAGHARAATALRWFLLLLMAGSLAADGLWLRPTLDGLAADIHGRGGFDAVGVDDPMRRQFGMYHGISFVLWTAEAALVLLVLALIHLPGRREPDGR
jgi:hypothetical protein